jgi:DedD protein
MRLPFFNRPSTKNNTPVEDGLTEDPERQRARHRLIGAIFLVTVAVAGLPIIFDSKPKQYNNDIAVQIIQPGAKDEKKADPKPEESRAEAAAPNKDANKEAKKEEPKSDKPAPVAKTLDKGEEVLSILEDRKSTPAAHSGKYIVQIGAFSSEERVKNWQKKLNEQKVSTYVDIKTAKDGGKLHLLRSGPYSDRAAAEAAEKKVKYVGLSPKIIEQKSE